MVLSSEVKGPWAATGITGETNPDGGTDLIGGGDTLSICGIIGGCRPS